MSDGVDGLLRDKTRPSRIPPLDPEVAERVVALTLADPPARPPTGPPPPWPRRSASPSARCSASGAPTASSRTGSGSSSSPTIPGSSTSCATWSGSIVDPPAHAIVLSVDEKSQIQALDRTQPGLPMKKGRLGTMTHDYKRHGTTTLFAALNVLDGTVIGRNMPRHRHQEFIRFLNAIERKVPADKLRPRHPRQLRRPQAPQGPRLARPSSPLHLPLRANLLLLAQRRRRLLRQALQAPAQTRRLPLHRRPPGRHQPLRPRAQRRTQPLHLDRQPRQNHRRRQARASSVTNSIH